MEAYGCGWRCLFSGVLLLAGWFTVVTPAHAASDCANDNGERASACLLAGSSKVVGSLDAPGTARYFRLDTPTSGLHVRVGLPDPPADYDLYLQDDTGAGHSCKQERRPCV
jgi:hypothetical protein